MRTNTKSKTPKIHTAEGAVAVPTSTYNQLRRSVMACLLWEDAFYEEGEGIHERIAKLATQVTPSQLAKVAIEARNEQHIRHASLLLAAIMAKNVQGSRVSETIQAVVQRADELTEFLAIYAKVNGIDPTKKPNDLNKRLSNQVRKGLALAFTKFDAYQLAKYDRAGAISLKSAMFLVHPKPVDGAMDAMWKQLVNGTLAVPDTWEVAISAAKGDKERVRSEWERLISIPGRLGDMAFIRNLRNMEQAGVDKSLIRMSFEGRHWRRVLPFRFLAAAEHAPWAEQWLDAAMVSSLENGPGIPGHTTIVMDVSGSMGDALSRKSKMTRAEAAAALVGMLTAASEDSSVWLTAGSDSTRIHKTELVASRTGAAMRDLIRLKAGQLGGGGIFLTPCLRHIENEAKTATDRIVVITDEQDCAIADKDKPSLAKPFGKRNYLLNVSVEKNGIGYGSGWTHIDGWSENVIRFIRDNEVELG